MREGDGGGPMLLAYATQTSTRRNLYTLKTYGWRLLVTPDSFRKNSRRHPQWHDGSLAPFALDNGAWGAFCAKKPWEPAPFCRLVGALGDKADFIVVPDIVAGGLASLELSAEWHARCRWRQPKTRLLVPVQDGMEPHHVAELASRPNTGLFLGGDTDWKLQTMPAWGKWCRENGIFLHVGRVNTAQRIRLCAESAAHSFDGTSITKFASTSELLQWNRYSNPTKGTHPWQSLIEP